MIPQERALTSNTFGVKQHQLTHSYDLEEFARQANHVSATFAWVTELQEEIREKNQTGYIAPYFIFAQSSGMGKTKIMLEYKKGQRKQKNGKAVILVLCSNQISDDSRQVTDINVVDSFVDFRSMKYDHLAFDEAAVWQVFQQLDQAILPMDVDGDLVVMFDEAQSLLETRIHPSEKAATEKEDATKKQEATEAFLFRAVRLWISLQRKTRIVAVFASTTAKLANFDIVDDLFDQPTSTRSYRKKLTFYRRGSSLYSPFFTTTIMGCLRKIQSSRSLTNSYGPTEYQVAIGYGRPLFAAMNESQTLTEAAQATIVSRMLLDDTTWTNDRSYSSWISILGTRVQMGLMLNDIRSTLVGC